MSTRRQIVIRLSTAAQLFTVAPVSAMSPDYTEYTAQPAMDTVRDLVLRRSPPKDEDLVLVIELPADQLHPGLDDKLTVAVRRWTTVQNIIDDDATSAGGAVGRRLFVVGVLAFLALQVLSIVVRRLGDDWDNYLVDAVGEGLSVTSWVMLWFPVQIFTVEAWRSRIRRRRAAAISRMTVRTRPVEGRTTGP